MHKIRKREQIDDGSRLYVVRQVGWKTEEIIYALLSPRVVSNQESISKIRVGGQGELGVDVPVRDWNIFLERSLWRKNLHNEQSETKTNSKTDS